LTNEEALTLPEHVEYKAEQNWEHCRLFSKRRTRPLIWCRI